MERCLCQTTRGNTSSYNAMSTSRGSVAQYVRSLSTLSAARFRLARSKYGQIQIRRCCCSSCRYSFSHPIFSMPVVCPGWVIGNLEALAGAKSGHILAGMLIEFILVDLVLFRIL